MLSVVIRTGRDGDSLVRTLGSLFPAIAEGMVRDGYVLGETACGAVRAIADAAGCDLIEGPYPAALADAFSRARSGHALVLAAGTVLESEWWLDAGRFLDFGESRHARHAVFRLAPADGGPAALIDATKVAIANRLFGRTDPRQGVIMPIPRGEAPAVDASGRLRLPGRPHMLRARAYPLASRSPIPSNASGARPGGA